MNSNESLPTISFYILYKSSNIKRAACISSPTDAVEIKKPGILVIRMYWFWGCSLRALQPRICWHHHARASYLAERTQLSRTKPSTNVKTGNLALRAHSSVP